MTMQASFTRKLRRAERHLRKVSPELGAWIQESGKCTLEPEWEREPYESLVRAIAHQQLHAKAAEAILGRLLKLFPRTPFPSPKQVLSLAPETLRSLGFSTAKTTAILGIAEAAKSKSIPSRRQADTMSDEALIEALVELRGVGRWTVEMLLIFSLGRMDVMPCDDYGVRVGLMHLCELDDMPKRKVFPELTDAWAPYRSVGAWYLWRLADHRKSVAAE